MEFYDAVYRIAWLRKRTVESIGLGLGHTAAYVSGQKSRGSLPKIDTAVKMLDECDYVLCAVPKESVQKDAIVIDLPAED